jgi:hypothetical protein
VAAAVVRRTGVPSAYVNPLIGSRNGGNTFPGAVVPFAMVQWSETPFMPLVAGVASSAVIEKIFNMVGFTIKGLLGMA